MIAKILEYLASVAIVITIIFGCFFAVGCMANSVNKNYMSRQCSQAGGIPVEVANYIHCHE